MLKIIAEHNPETPAELSSRQPSNISRILKILDLKHLKGTELLKLKKRVERSGQSLNRLILIFSLVRNTLNLMMTLGLNLSVKAA